MTDVRSPRIAIVGAGAMGCIFGAALADAGVDVTLVDGCTRWQALWKIAMPLAAPGLVTAGAFAFIFSWTEFLFALVLTSKNAVTLPVVLSGYIGLFQGNLWGETAAMTLISLIPAVILGTFLQRHLVRGLTVGAVQG